MLIIGLTGGIGTGKSTAAEYFIEKGFAHIDADYIGHQITADGMPIVDTLNEVFGPGTEYNKENIPILLEPGKLDRKAMARVAFTNEEANEKFDEIMFAAIIEEIERQIVELKEESKEMEADGETGYPGIIIDAPLLFESGANELCDFVILITADMEERIMRVTLRDKATRKEIQNRIDSQMDDEMKERLADYVIDNSDSVDELYERLDELMESIADDLEDYI